MAGEAEESKRYLVISGVRRAKAAYLLGRATISARECFPDGSTGTIFQVPVECLYSSREDIPIYSNVLAERWQSVFEASRNGIDLSEIDIELMPAGIEGITIADVQFRVDADD